MLTYTHPHLATSATPAPQSKRALTSPLHGLTSDIQKPTQQLIELIGDLTGAKTKYDTDAHVTAVTDTTDGTDAGFGAGTATAIGAGTGADTSTIYVDIDIATEFTRRMGMRLREEIRKRSEQVKR